MAAQECRELARHAATNRGRGRGRGRGGRGWRRPDPARGSGYRGADCGQVRYRHEQGGPLPYHRRVDHAYPTQAAREPGANYHYRSFTYQRGNGAGGGHGGYAGRGRGSPPGRGRGGGYGGRGSGGTPVRAFRAARNENYFQDGPEPNNQEMYYGEDPAEANEETQYEPCPQDQFHVYEEEEYPEEQVDGYGDY